MKDRLMCFTPWDVQSKRQYSIDGVYPALNAGQGIGGQAHGVCYAIQGNLVDRNVGMNGIGVSDEGVSYTLNEIDRHAVCYAFTWRGRENGCNVETQEELAYCLREPGGGGSNPMVLINKEPYQTDTVKSPPDRVFQNTGHGWWTESTVCETVRTPCGGDSMKANLIVEKIDGKD